MSLSSARVGLRLTIIDSSKFVATLTGTLDRFALRMIAFCSKRNVFERHFARQVAAVDEDFVGSGEDFVEILHAAFALNFGNDCGVGSDQSAQELARRRRYWRTKERSAKCHSRGRWRPPGGPFPRWAAAAGRA